MELLPIISLFLEYILNYWEYHLQSMESHVIHTLIQGDTLILAPPVGLIPKAPIKE